MSQPGRPRSIDEHDPIADYIEWTNNRFSPGYYLGGKIPSYLNKSRLGFRGRRLAGVALMLSAMMVLPSLFLMVRLPDGASRLQILAVVLEMALFAAAGFAMMRSSTDDQRRHEHGPRRRKKRRK